METPIALRVTEAHATAYRHAWKGSVVSTILTPVLYLLAMGVGLGSLVDRNSGLPGVSYLSFLAPGLLAATAMLTAVGESTWMVMAGFKWRKTYYAVISTPVDVSDLVTGKLTWTATRVAISSLVFATVMMAFRVVSPAWGLLAILPAVLTGVAMGAPTMAYSSTIHRSDGLAALMRFGVVPMFLFSGTFFPITQLPGWMQPLAYLTPLWHGVELCRAVTLQVSPHFPWWVHAGYLAAWAVAGWLLAIDRLTRKMVQ